MKTIRPTTIPTTIAVLLFSFTTAKVSPPFCPADSVLLLVLVPVLITGTDVVVEVVGSTVVDVNGVAIVGEVEMLVIVGGEEVLMVVVLV